MGREIRYVLFFSKFNETWILSTDFLKILKYQISWISFQWESSCCMWTDGRTDVTKLSSCFATLRKRLKTNNVEVYKEIITLCSRTYKIINTRCEQNVEFLILNLMVLVGLERLISGGRKGRNRRCTFYWNVVQRWKIKMKLHATGRQDQHIARHRETGSTYCTPQGDRINIFDTTGRQDQHIARHRETGLTYLTPQGDRINIVHATGRQDQHIAHDIEALSLKFGRNWTINA